MKKNIALAWVGLLFASSLLSACGPAQLFGPTLTPTPTITPTPAPTSTSTPTPTAAVTDIISAIPLNCDDQAVIDHGVYRAENNTWGKGTLSGWSQCIGLGADLDGTLVGRWTWDWPISGTNVKAYPEVIFGQKPGSTTTSSDLPRQISSVSDLTITYDVTSTYTGSGNLAFDIWLTDSQNPAKFAVPPITHEIMIWLDRFGSLSSGGRWVENIDIDGVRYSVYLAEKWGDGWGYIAFVRSKPQTGAGTLDLVQFLSYLRDQNLITGNEYIASIELGNEIVGGSGETILNQFEVSVR